MKEQAQGEQTTMMADAPPPRPVELRPIQLDAPRHYQLNREALVHRIERLKAMAKQAIAEGYIREGRTFLADADRIEHGLLQKYTMQQDLPLVERPGLKEKITNKVQLMVVAAFEGLGPKSKRKFSEAEIRRKRDNLVQQLSEWATTYGCEVARVAHDGGYAQSRVTGEFYAAKALGDGIVVRGD